ncbi:MAG: hypothetical protein JST00_00905 [Deltaproteobacteria bacterium]|nr:hypothetical protein [Deltaproteobacteria bacterium]
MAALFHQEALARMGLQHVFDPEAMDSLKARAATLGVTFPASFVEWYGMPDAINLLRRNSNCDDPIEIERLGETFQWRWDEKQDWLRDGLLLFMFENQAVCVWALHLDGSDDPPVVVARDPDLKWRPCADRFSTFIACQVWDHREVFNEDGAHVLLQAQAVPLHERDLAFLRKGFDQKPTTHGWPGDNQYRFQRGDYRVLVWDSKEQADWWITASSEDRVGDLASELWGCADLQTSLWSNDARGEAVLKRLRAKHPTESI